MTPKRRRDHWLTALVLYGVCSPLAAVGLVYARLGRFTPAGIAVGLAVLTALFAGQKWRAAYPESEEE